MYVLHIKLKFHPYSYLSFIIRTNR